MDLKKTGKNKESIEPPTKTFQYLNEYGVCSILGDGVDGIVAVENWIKFTYLQIDSFRFMNLKCIPFYTVFYNYYGLDYNLPFEIFISSTQITKGDRFLHYLQHCQVFLHHQIVKENTQNICFPLFPA